jgi:hypothetical protein
MQKSSNLLIAEHPLLVLPTLAQFLGINEAIVLQQVQYWLSINEKGSKQDHFIDGRWWCWNTVEDWHKQFTWISLSTLNRILAKLEGLGILDTACYNKSKMNRTKWYSINHEELDRLFSAFCQADNMGSVTPTECIVETRQNDLYTEITHSETTDPEIEHKLCAPRTSSKRSAGKAFHETQCRGLTVDSVQDKEPEPAEPTVDSSPVKTSNCEDPKIPQRTRSVPRILQKKKTAIAPALEFDKDGWLQLPKGSGFARARAIATRLIQESLVDLLEYLDWVEDEETGELLIENTKTDEIAPPSIALDKKGGLALRALRGYAVAHAELSQCDFNSDLQDAFDDAMRLQEKYGDRVFECLEKIGRWSDALEELF